MTRTLTLAAAPLAALLLLTGCAMDEESFATKYAEEYCAYLEECDYIEFMGGSYDACVEIQETAELTLVTNDACEYDPGAASDCIQELKDQTCPEDDASGDAADATPSCSSVCGG